MSPKTKTFWGGFNGLPTQGFSGNYVVNASSGYFNPGGAAGSASANGVMFAQSKVTLTDITDGTSNTAMVSELLLVADTTGHDIRGRYYNPAHSGVSFSTRLTPNSPVPDQFNSCHNTVAPAYAPCISTTTNMFVTTRSRHPQGVNMALADGSVRFIRQTVNPITYTALGSRNGGEIPGDL